MAGFEKARRIARDAQRLRNQMNQHIPERFPAGRIRAGGR
jgi:hypothetical protein